MRKLQGGMQLYNAVATQRERINLQASSAPTLALVISVAIVAHAFFFLNRVTRFLRRPRTPVSSYAGIYVTHI